MANRNFFNALGGFAQGFQNAFSMIQNLKLQRSQLDLQRERMVQRELEREGIAEFKQEERTYERGQDALERDREIKGMEAKRLTAETGKFHTLEPAFDDARKLMGYNVVDTGVDYFGEGRLTGPQMDALAERLGVKPESIDIYGRLIKDKKDEFKGISEEEAQNKVDWYIENYPNREVVSKIEPTGEGLVDLDITTRPKRADGDETYDPSDYTLSKQRISRSLKNVVDTADIKAVFNTRAISTEIKKPSVVFKDEDANTLAKAVAKRTVSPPVAEQLPSSMVNLHDKLDIGAFEGKTRESDREKYASNIWLYEPNGALVATITIDGVKYVVPREQITEDNIDDVVYEPFRRHLPEIWRREYGYDAMPTADALDSLYIKYGSYDPDHTTQLEGIPTLGDILGR